MTHKFIPTADVFGKRSIGPRSACPSSLTTNLGMPPAVLKVIEVWLSLVACVSAGAQTCDPNSAVNAKSCYGAKGNVQTTNGGCSMTAGSPALTCTSAPFVSADVGKTIYVQGAGTSGASLSSTISSYNSATKVTLANNAATTVSGNSIFWATDDTTALQNAYNYAVAHGYALYIPSGGGYLHHGLNWTGNNIKVYGDAYGGTDLYAIAVTDPGKINGSAPAVGVDISGSAYNQISNIAFWGSLGQWPDLAPTINVLGGRSGGSGNAFSIAHIFEADFFVTYGTYNVALYGYEQSDFHDCHFETDVATTSGNLYLSAADTPSFVSPYVNLVSPPTSMLKVNVSGGRSTFSGTGKMVVLDQGTTESDYTMSFRDLYANMGNNSVFLSGTGSGAIRHITLDSVYAEVGGGNVRMVNLAAPAWNWRIANAQIYNGGGLTVSPYTFASGFLDGEVLIDSVGQAPGYSNPEFNSSSCAGSVLHLGQEQPTTNCTNYASLNSVSGYTLGPAQTFTGGHAACWKTNGTIGYCSSAVSASGTCTCN